MSNILVENCNAVVDFYLNLKLGTFEQWYMHLASSQREETHEQSYDK